MANFNSTKSDYKKVLEKTANNNHLEEEKKQPKI